MDGVKHKILVCNQLEKELDSLRKKGKKIVHCHGVFDLLHPGHIEHFRQAKKLGDILVVSITTARYVNKGPHRPYFNDETRAETIAELVMVDYVVLSDYPTAVEIINVVKPSFYAKGNEYSRAENDVTGEIKNEIDAVMKVGGSVHFTEGQVFSSTKLLNNNFSDYSEETQNYLKKFAKKYPFDSVREMINGFSKLKVLVIGDVIIDEYVFCEVKGLMSKDRAYSALYQKEEQYLGGALAIASHIASFCDNVTVMSIIGDEPKLEQKINSSIHHHIKLRLISDASFKTPVKRRYIEKHSLRNEYNKLFSMNLLMQDEEVLQYDRHCFYVDLERTLDDFDLVVVADYGHGLLDSVAIGIIEERARFLAVNAQTNSTNFGTNLITRYKRADTFTLDQREIELAFNTHSSEYETMMPQLMKRLGGKQAWLTLGAQGALGISEDLQIGKAPALTLAVKDTIGAGDAFYAIASLCAVKHFPNEIGSLLGNMAGAMAANVIGNSTEVDKIKYLKYLKTILNY